VKKIQSFPFIIILVLMHFNANHATGCSMYKITCNGKTMVGSNYDAYYLTSKIWFENGRSTGEYGAVFSGGRFDGSNGYAPQSGMNEMGLAFSGAAVPFTDKELPDKPGKKQIASRTNFLKDILHKCRTVEEVRDYMNQYNYSALPGDLFMYVDKSGRYLLKEPDTMILGFDPKYLASNFCPSSTSESDAMKMAKYSKGVTFLKNKMDTSIAFCAALSDTMSVCRKRMGDGTLLTCIRDLNEGMVYYYFYHDYKHPVKFNLKEELQKGDHMYAVPDLFPPNSEYERLASYKTPQSSETVCNFLFFCCGLFMLSSLFFIVSYFRRRNKVSYNGIKLASFVAGIMLAFYMLVLIRTELIFYLSAPYKSYSFSVVDITSYIPFLLLALIIPLSIVNFKIFKKQAWSKWSTWLFTINNLMYLTLIVLFAYWGLYNIFS
jgi:hypothetical protein